METTSTIDAPIGPVVLRYGLLAGLLSVLFTFALYATGQETNQWLPWLGIVIAIGAIYLAHNAYKGQNKGFMSYGQGLGIGMLVTLVSAVLSSVFSYVYRTFIDPDMTARILDKSREKMEAAGNMSDEQIEQAMKMAAKFTAGPIALVFGLVFALLLGLILSLIIAAITKNAKPEFE